MPAMNEDLPAPLESLGPCPATVTSPPETIGTGCADSREMLISWTPVSTRVPTTSVLSGLATVSSPLNRRASSVTAILFSSSASPPVPPSGPGARRRRIAAASGVSGPAARISSSCSRRRAASVSRWNCGPGR